MKKDYIEASMHPIRQRIVQYLMINGESTTAQIGMGLSDVPRASLYRHMKILLDAEVICVVDETKQRGTMEKTYAIKSVSYEENDAEDMYALYQSALMQVTAAFNEYFQGNDCDPQRDCLTISSATLLMSDEEYMEFLQELGQLMEKAMKNQPSNERKERSFNVISVPVIDKHRQNDKVNQTVDNE